MIRRFVPFLLALLALFALPDDHRRGAGRTIGAAADQRGRDRDPPRHEARAGHRRQFPALCRRQEVRRHHLLPRRAQPEERQAYGLVQGGINHKVVRAFNPIPHEPTSRTGLRHVDGTISMARNAPGSAMGDFFFTLGAAPYLDARAGSPGYAAFGQLVEGKAVLQKILAGATHPGGWSVETKGQSLVAPVRIISARRVLLAARQPRRQVVPPAPSSRMIPSAASSARMRSASAKSRFFLASRPRRDQRVDPRVAAALEPGRCAAFEQAQHAPRSRAGSPDRRSPQPRQRQRRVEIVGQRLDHRRIGRRPARRRRRCGRAGRASPCSARSAASDHSSGWR